MTSTASLRLLLIGLLLASPAFAFELERVDDNPCGTARNIFWPSAVAPVDTSELTPAQFQQLANEAMQRWNVAASLFKFQSAFGHKCDLTDGVVTMAFSDRLCDGSSFGDAIAVTVTRYDRNSGQLTDADLLFDSAESAFQNADLFREVAMHELGHVLGLDHSDACGASGAGTLMNSTIYLSATRLTSPQSDDITGVNFIYPAPGNDTSSSSSNGCAIGNRRSPGGFAWLLAPVLLLLPLRRLLRRRRTLT